MNNQPLELSKLSTDQLQTLFSQTAFADQINKFNLAIITQELLRREQLESETNHSKSSTPIKLPKLNKREPAEVTGSFAIGNE